LLNMTLDKTPPGENQFGIYVYIIVIKARDTTINEIQWNLYT
jgi:hypothetical protein